MLRSCCSLANRSDSSAEGPPRSWLQTRQVSALWCVRGRGWSTLGSRFALIAARDYKKLRLVRRNRDATPGRPSQLRYGTHPGRLAACRSGRSHEYVNWATGRGTCRVSLRRRGPGPHATSHEVKPGKKIGPERGKEREFRKALRRAATYKPHVCFPLRGAKGSLRSGSAREGTRRRGGRPGDLISDQRNLAPWGGRTGTERTGPDRNESDRIESWTLPDAGNPCPSDALSRVSQGSDRESVRSVYMRGERRRETERVREQREQ